MDIAVIGAGSIGSLLAAILTYGGARVTLICRPREIGPLRERGLTLTLPATTYACRPDVRIRLERTPDLAVFATHLNDLEQAYQDNHEHLETAPILTVQSGVQGANILSCHFEPEKIMDGAVLFENIKSPQAPLTLSTPAAMMLGRPFYANDRRVFAVADLLRPLVDTRVISEIRAAKWLKLLADYIYCLPALTGQPLGVLYEDDKMRLVFHALIKEALHIIDIAGIPIVSLPGLEADDMRAAARTPPGDLREMMRRVFLRGRDLSACGYLRRQIVKQRQSEVDYINGEIVQVSSSLRMTVPLNELFLRLVHQVEIDGGFLSREDVLSAYRPFHIIG